ncbi:hypothetical protein ZY05719_07825 [Streptococcus suis]|nr:hypothetical protein ZY05719_07825 [Streptococcus suis]ARX90871.1 hypothetical protein A9494_07645 [Streptococcus suis]PNS45069.1 hypothetical protein LI88_05055 [Streptococcus suis]
MRLGKKPRTTTQSSCQHLSAVVDWQICSCFALQIWPNQLCGGGKTNSFYLGRVLIRKLKRMQKLPPYDIIKAKNFLC